MVDKRFAVVDIEDWEALLEWLETSQDVQIAGEAYARLKAPGCEEMSSKEKRLADARRFVL